MAYMHKEMFEITMDEQYRGDFGYFEIDDPIALPVQVLNRKGYITEWCCAGHPPFHLINSPLIRFCQCSSYIVFKENVSLPSLPPGFVAENMENVPDNAAYLIKPPGVPRSEEDLIVEEAYRDGCLKDKRIIIRFIFDECNDVFSFFLEQVRVMEELYEWAVGLPKFKG